MRRVLLFLAAAVLAGCVRNPVTGKREFHAISEKAELNLGAESKREIIKEYGQYVNPTLQAYVNEVGGRVAGGAERKNIQYEFIILDTPLVNAFAVPGVVFLTRGILELIDDEAELAAVIGHEIGHITGFHAVKLIQKSYGYGFLATFAAIAGTIYSPALRDPKEYAAYYETLYRGIGLVTAGFLTGYGREFELEADRSGLRYAILAGYDPDAMTSFFKRMKSLEDDEAMGISIFLRTHPPTGERIKQVKRILAAPDEELKTRKKHTPDATRRIAQLLKSTTAQFEDNFERYQEVVKSIPKLESDSSGVLEKNAYMNTRWGLKLEVPDRWKIERAYGKALVSFYSPDGKAQGELQASHYVHAPVVQADADAPKKSKRGGFAGVSQSTGGVTSRQWAEAIEETLRFEKRTGRDVVYPAGPAYVGTYRGHDRLGRPAFFKMLFLLKPLEQGRQDGFILSCAAPDETYLDYLIDFEVIMKSLTWLPKKPS